MHSKNCVSTLVYQREGKVFQKLGMYSLVFHSSQILIKQSESCPGLSQRFSTVFSNQKIFARLGDFHNHKTLIIQWFDSVHSILHYQVRFFMTP